MSAQPTKLSTAAPRLGPPPYAGFGAALQAWLLRAGRSQKELADLLGVYRSTVTSWTQEHKRPNARSLVRLLAVGHGWFGPDWDPLEALDAVACLGYGWSEVQAASVRHFQQGGMFRPSRPGGRLPARRPTGSSSRRGRSSTRPAALNTL